MQRDDFLLILLPIVGVLFVGGFAIFLSRENSLAIPTKSDLPSVEIMSDVVGSETDEITPPVEPAPDPPPVSRKQFPRFVEVSLAPDLSLAGSGSNVDSPEFFIGTKPEESLLLVTGKSNDRIVIWRFPFIGTEEPPLLTDYRPNGIAVDQEGKSLIVGDASDYSLRRYTLPERTPLPTFGEDILGSGETNVSVYAPADGRKLLFATEEHRIRAFDSETGTMLADFAPAVDSIEEVLADPFHKVIYVPDEAGRISKTNPGGAILAFRPDGQPFERNGNSRFATEGMFAGDAEGITLYTCRDTNGTDTGTGFIIVADQSTEDNGFEIFNRETWFHLGTLRLEGVSGTDGIVASETPLPGYPEGLFAATNADKTVALIGWDKISGATGLSCH